MKAQRPSLTATLSPDDRISLASRSSMVDHLLAGAKPRSEWKTGLELELIGYRKDTLDRIDFSDLESILKAYSSEPIVDAGTLVGAGGPAGTLTLEPGGQLEYSGPPRQSLSKAECELRNYLSWVRERAKEAGMVFLAIGFDPLRTLDEQKWVAKRRYRIMRPLLVARGERGLDMMTRTAAIQANVDYGTVADLAEKFVIGNRLAPIASAIFANSPFVEGKLSGAKSERALVWLETDSDRCGIPSPAFAEEFSLDGFLDYVLSVPMFYVERDGDYVDLTGVTFGEYLEGSGEWPAPVFRDFTDHLTTIFTEARLKQWIELRSADGGGLEQVPAVLAFWKGLLYDANALADARRLMPRLDASQYKELQRQVAIKGLEAECNGVRVREVARSLVELSRDGLKAIAPEETRFLDVLMERVVREGICPADILIRNFEGAWHGQMREVIDYLSIA